MALKDRNTILLVPFNDEAGTRFYQPDTPGMTYPIKPSEMATDDNLAAPFLDNTYLSWLPASDDSAIFYTGIPAIAGKDFTLEFWIYDASGTATFEYVIFGQNRGVEGDSSQNFMEIFLDGSGNLKLRNNKRIPIEWSPDLETQTLVSIPESTWTHIRIIHKSNVYKIIINGVSADYTFAGVTWTETEWNDPQVWDLTLRTPFLVDHTTRSQIKSFASSTGAVAITGLKVSWGDLYSDGFANYPDPQNLWGTETADNRKRDNRYDISSDFPSDQSIFTASLDFNGAGFDDSSSEANALVETDITFSTDRISLDKSAVFNGTSSLIAIATNTEWDKLYKLTNQWTISCWVNFDTGTGLQTLFSHVGDSGNAFITCKVNRTSNTLNIVYRTNSTSVSLTGAYTFTDSKWYHIALVMHYDKTDTVGRLLCFIDGVLVDSVAVTATQTLTNSSFFILGKDGVGTDYFKGKMDNFRITNTMRYWQDFYVSNYSQNTRRVYNFPVELTTHPVSLHDPNFPQNIPDFTQGLNSVYIAGIQPNLRVREGEFKTLGLKPPLAPTLVEKSAPTDLTGDYDYVITLLDDDGNESGSSLHTSITGLTEDGVEVRINLDPLTSEQGVFTKIRIYRKNITDGETEYFLVEEVKAMPDDVPASNSFTYLDETLDEDVSTIIIAPDRGTGPPPTVNFIEFVPETGSIFYAAPEGEPTKVWFSDVNQAERVGANSFFFVGNDDSDWITGMKVLGGQLVVLKERSTYVVLGAGLNLSVEQRSGQIGCVSHESIISVGDFLFYAGDEGIYGFDGRTAYNISVDIDEIFNDMPDERKPYIKGSYDSENGYLLFAMSRVSTTDNDTILCFNYRDWFKDTERMERWTVWTIPGSDLTEGVMGTGRNPRVYIADTNSDILKVEGTDDAGAAIPFNVTFGERNMMRPGMEQHINDLSFLIRTTQTESLKLGYNYLGTDYLTTISYTTDINKALIGCDRRTHFLPVRFKSDGVTSEVSLYGVLVRGSQIGFR